MARSVLVEWKREPAPRPVSCRSRRLSVGRDRLPGMGRDDDRRMVIDRADRWSVLGWFVLGWSVLGWSVRGWSVLGWALRFAGWLLGCGVQPYGQTPAPVTPDLAGGRAPTVRCTHKLLKYFFQNRENSSNSRSCGWCGRRCCAADQRAWRAGDGAGGRRPVAGPALGTDWSGPRLSPSSPQFSTELSTRCACPKELEDGAPHRRGDTGVSPVPTSRTAGNPPFTGGAFLWCTAHPREW